MLRIHFTEADLARTRIAAGPDPLWEVLLSLHALQNRDKEIELGDWRRRGGRSLSLPRTRLLLQLAPPTGYSPDFLTPAGTDPELDGRLDALLSTPRPRVVSELRELAGYRPVTGWMRALARGEAGTMTLLGEAVRSYFATMIAPYWTTIRGAVAADRSTRVDQLVTGGVDELLTNLHPRVRWRRPVLEILDFVDHDLYLDGRGLTLQPAFFCSGAPTKLRDPSLPPMLVHPIRRAPVALIPDDQTQRLSDDPLRTLLGRSRAAALAATVNGCTTTDLARRCSISMGAASQQASALRNAGLITTRRDGLSVVHEISPLGLQLLAGSPGPHARPQPVVATAG